MTTVGAGKYTYKLVQDWATLPRGETFGTVSAVATDSQDRVYVFQRGDPPMLVFDPEGSYLSSWSTGAFNRPHGICISDDIVYVTDSDDSVAMRLTLDGRPLQTLGTRGAHSDTGTEQYGDLVPRAAGPFNHPTKLAPAPWGDLYVSDGERNSRVHRFSSNGQLIASWGEPGKDGPDQFHMPHSVLVDRDSRIYVCDRENSRIQVFSADGQFVTMWTDLRPPTDIAVDKDGVFYVSQFAFNVTHRYPDWPPPTGSGSALKDAAGRRTIRPDAPPRISVLDREGKTLARWESRKAHGLWVDSRGDIYLAVEDEKTVDKYVRQG